LNWGGITMDGQVIKATGIFSFDFINAINFPERQSENLLVKDLSPWFEEPSIQKRIEEIIQKLSTLPSSEVSKLFEMSI
jgi:hypothetical protein